MEENPFWGEPTPTDLWDDMDKLNGLYEELGWDHTDYLDFAIEGGKMTEAHTNGNLSVVIPMDDMELILTQMWKSRDTEPKMGELYKKYRELTTFEK